MEQSRNYCKIAAYIGYNFTTSLKNKRVTSRMTTATVRHGKREGPAWDNEGLIKRRSIKATSDKEWNKSASVR
jgi:hypothetical protein